MDIKKDGHTELQGKTKGQGGDAKRQGKTKGQGGQPKAKKSKKGTQNDMPPAPVTNRDWVCSMCNTPFGSKNQLVSACRSCRSRCICFCL